MAPLHSSLGNRARLRLKKNEKKERKKEGRKEGEKKDEVTIKCDPHGLLIILENGFSTGYQVISRKVCHTANILFLDLGGGLYGCINSVIIP